MSLIGEERGRSMNLSTVWPSEMNAYIKRTAEKCRIMNFILLNLKPLIVVYIIYTNGISHVKFL